MIIKSLKHGKNALQRRVKNAKACKEYIYYVLPMKLIYSTSQALVENTRAHSLCAQLLKLTMLVGQHFWGISMGVLQHNGFNVMKHECKKE